MTPDDRLDAVDAIIRASPADAARIYRAANVSRQLRGEWSAGRCAPTRATIARIAIAAALLDTDRPDVTAELLRAHIERTLISIR